MGRHGEHRSLPGDAYAVTRKIEEVLQRGEAQRDGHAVDQSVERLVERAPVIDGSHQHGPLGNLFNQAREHEGFKETRRLAAQVQPLVGYHAREDSTHALRRQHRVHTQQVRDEQTGDGLAIVTIPKV